MFPLDSKLNNQDAVKRLKLLVQNYHKRGNSKITSKISAESFQLIKLLFYCPTNYSYSLIKTIHFISENKIYPNDFVNYTSEVINDFFSDRTVGQKRAEQYIKALKSTKKLDLCSNNRSSLKDGKNINDLFRIVDLLHETINCTKDQAVKKVYDISFSGIKQTTFRRLYFDQHINSDF